MVARGTSFPSSSTTRTSNPGMAFPALPGLVSRGGWSRILVLRSLPAWGTSEMPDSGEPDSDDHQLSMTNAPSAAYLFNRPWYMVMMAGSERSPARNRALRLRKPPRWPICVKNLLSGSSLRIARRAVGAVLFRSTVSLLHKTG